MILYFTSNARKLATTKKYDEKTVKIKIKFI